MKTSEIQIRDPFVYAEDGVYYLYGSTDKDIWKADGVGFDVYTSTDLTDWTPRGNIFDRPARYWGQRCFWAPEMHVYEGKYYLFASFIGDGYNRGTAVLKADSPLGPFRPWSSGALTPKEWMCLDGTLYVEDGVPYLIFCHEWVQTHDGEICLMPLTKDLSAPAGEVKRLFTASMCKWANNIAAAGETPSYVTDGPNMYRMRDGRLCMLWSTCSPVGYAIGCAVSDSGKAAGPWRIEDEPIYEKDGGHGMIFTASDGKKYLAIHTPNITPNERAVFLEIEERDGSLRLK